VNGDGDHWVFARRLSRELFPVSLGRLLLHRAALVVAAVGTRLMRLLHLVAVRALRQRRLGQKIVRSSGARPSLRMPAFWVRHSNSPRAARSERIVSGFRPVILLFF